MRGYREATSPIAKSRLPKIFCQTAFVFTNPFCNNTAKMVRLKNRYLLVNIPYPELEKNQSKSKVPDVIAFNQPTTDQLDGHALSRGIKKEVATLFGDYGSGAVADSLIGNSLSSQCDFIFLIFCSQILVSSDIDIHHPSFARALQISMGSLVSHDESAG